MRNNRYTSGWHNLVAKKKGSARKASAVDVTIGERIRARRLELGLSQTALADELGITFQQVQKYERGVNRVSAATLLDICTVLEVEIAALLPPRKGAPKGADDLAALAPLLAKITPEGKELVAELVRTLAARGAKTRKN